MHATCLVCAIVPGFKQNNSQYRSPRCCKTFVNVLFLYEYLTTRDMRLLKYFSIVTFFSVSPRNDVKSILGGLVLYVTLQ